MAIGDDWTINYATKVISHTAGSTVYTSQAFYSWLQETFANQDQMDDDVPMSAQTPTVFTMINEWVFNADSDLQYLNGGAITVEHVDSESSADLWANIYTIGSLESGTVTFIEQSATEYTRFWDSGFIDVLLKVKELGTWVGSGTVTLYAREYTDLFDHFDVDLTGGGRNPVPLATFDDGNNVQDSATVDAYTFEAITVAGKLSYSSETGTPTVGERIHGATSSADFYILEVNDLGTTGSVTVGLQDGYYAPADITAGETFSGTVSAGFAGNLWDKTVQTINKDLNNGAGPKPYGMIVDCKSSALLSVYNWSKWITRRSSTAFKLWEHSGTVITERDGQFYQQLRESITPSKQAPLGTFAGGKLFGARSIWFQNFAANQSYQFIDDNGATQQPPTTVYVVVSELSAGDSVAVFALSGSLIKKDKYIANSGSVNASGDSVLQVTTSTIATDEPAAGYVRVVHANGEDRYKYAGVSGSYFTGLNPTLARDYTSTNVVYVPYLDASATAATMQNELIYDTDISVLIRVRRYGIIPFEIGGTIGSTGISQAAIRTTDTIVT